MIKDEWWEYWVTIKPRRFRKKGVYYCPDDEREYMEHWGKWLIFGKLEYLESLAQQLDEYINKGLIDSAKYNRKPSPVGRGDCVMCIYCDDRDKDRVWSIILSTLGIAKQLWEYDAQTHHDWQPGGRLYNKALVYAIEATLVTLALGALSPSKRREEWKAGC